MLQTNGLNSSVLYSAEKLREKHGEKCAEYAFVCCVFSYFSGQSVTLRDRLFWNICNSEHTALLGTQSTAWLWFGPGPKIPQNLSKRCTTHPLLCGSFWRAQNAQGGQKLWLQLPPAQDYGCSFHACLADSFLPPSVDFFSSLRVSNQWLSHGTFLCRALNTAFLAKGAFHTSGFCSCCLLLQVGLSCQSNPNAMTITLAALHIHWFAEVFCIALSSKTFVTTHYKQQTKERS